MGDFYLRTHLNSLCLIPKNNNTFFFIFVLFRFVLLVLPYNKFELFNHNLVDKIGEMNQKKFGKSAKHVLIIGIIS